MGALTQAARTLASVPIPGASKYGPLWGLGTAPFTLPDEASARTRVGDGSGTSLATAVVNWMGRELLPARRVLLELPASDRGVPRVIRQHEVLTLLAKPTRDPRYAPRGYYGGSALNMAIGASWVVAGDCYRFKVRSGAGIPVQYWYLPHWCIEPVGTPTRFIDHYRYELFGETHKLDVNDVDHMRFGLDPMNPRRGLSPLRGVLRELLTDEEAARFSASILMRVGFPGAVIIPGQGVEVEPEDRKEIKARFDQEFGGDGRGRTIVLSANAEVKFLSWSPKELDLSSLRDVTEERVSAAVGIPAAVLGWGTGLQQVKVGATMTTLRAMAWESALIPFLEELARNETEQLLPEFIDPRDLERYEIAWDLSRVAALSDLHLKRAEIEATLVRARIKTVDESRIALGYAPVGGADGGFQASPGVGGGAPGDRPRRAAEDEGEGDDGDDEDDEEEAATGQNTPRVDNGAAPTPRQRAIAAKLMEGRTHKEIASAMGVSERTVSRVATMLRVDMASFVV